jgi:hypothetical protein
VIDWNAKRGELLSEWAGNARLRYGVYAMLAIIWLGGILALRDLAVAKRQAWQDVESRIVRAKRLAASGDWASRSTEAKAALADFQSVLWKEGSVGFAQAAIQEKINRSLASAGLPARRVSVAASDTPISAELADIVPMRARVSTDFREQALYTWLGGLRADVDAKRPALMVESLIIRGSPSPVVDVELVGYLLKGADNPDAAGAQK